MAVILQGNLAHFRIGRLLTALSEDGHTGVLEVMSGKQKARIVFRKGRAMHAEATGAPTAKDAVLAPFTWSEGTFTFADDAISLADVAAAPLDLAAVIEEGNRRAAHASIDPKIVFRVVEDPGVQGDISVSQQDFRMLLRIGSGRTLEQLAEELQSPVAEVWRTVQKLEENGMVRRISADKAQKRIVTAPMEKVSPPPPPPASPPSTPAPQPETAKPERKSSLAEPAPLIGSLTAANGSMFPVLDPEVVVGRDPSCAISINDASISGTHAKIKQGSEGFFLEDLSSRNGTYVNGERLTQPRLLADQDVVRLGKVVMTFHLAVPAPIPRATVMQKLDH